MGHDAAIVDGPGHRAVQLSMDRHTAFEIRHDFVGLAGHGRNAGDIAEPDPHA